MTIGIDSPLSDTVIAAPDITGNTGVADILANTSYGTPSDLNGNSLTTLAINNPAALIQSTQSNSAGAIELTGAGAGNGSILADAALSCSQPLSAAGVSVIDPVVTNDTATAATSNTVFMMILAGLAWWGFA
jgi:hypothetical protein